MKKVLIIAYDFPPYNSIGAQRPYSWFKYFKEYGIYPIILTRHWEENIKNPTDYIKPSKKKEVEIKQMENATVIRVPFKPNLRDRFIVRYGLTRLSFIRKFLSLYFSIARFLSNYADNTAIIYKTAKEYLKENHCDVILATGEPFILFKYASKLSNEFSVPWIADYRDGWSTNSPMAYSNFFNRILIKYYFQKLEKKCLNNVKFICTAAPAYKKDLEQLSLNKQIEVVFNGYDPDVVQGLKNISQNNECFEIAYSGTIYPRQQLELFLEGYRNFIRETNCKDTKVIFYGLDFYEEQRKRLLSFDEDLNNFFVTTERLPQKMALQKLKSANLLLLLADDQTEPLAAKIFEYLALNRKILLVKDDKGILSKIMNECNGGIKCSTSSEVTETLKKLYLEKKDKGFIEHQSVNYTFYNRQKQAEVLANIIKQCAE
ncbi:hypothetical protein JYU16_01755 [bacterium AH-315-M05]|nr:hypothetical protein [bacterium AH-315-M05]